MYEGEQSHGPTSQLLSCSCTSQPLAFKIMANWLTINSGKRDLGIKAVSESRKPKMYSLVSRLCSFVDARGSQLDPTSTAYRIILAHAFGES
jgi:hypothetical protein